MTFPLNIKDIPRIKSMTIYVDDGMRDDKYHISILDRRQEGRQEGREWDTTTFFKDIESLFIPNSDRVQEQLSHLNQNFEVVCNLDAAYNLKNYIDSWVSEAKLMKLRGTWKGL